MRQALLTAFALLSILAAATAPTPVAAAQSDGLAPEGVSVHIAVQGDGDARWTISTRYNLNDSSDKRAFEQVASSFERGEGDTGFSLQTFEAVVPEVQDRTGRNMSIESPEWTSEVVNESRTRWGYLRLSFTWTNFAKVENDTMTLGGVFRGGWFGDLERGQTLVVKPPPGFDVSSAQPSHETVNGTLRWTGPVDFGPNEPRASFVRQPEPAGVPWMSIAGAMLTALVIGGIIAYTWFWRTSRGTTPAAGTASPDGDGATGTTSQTETAAGTGAVAAGTGTANESTGDGGETTGSAGGSDASGSGTTADAAGEADASGTGMDAGDAAETDAGAATGAAGAAAGAGAADAEEGGRESDEESEPVPELLSDEERVERLLAENNGRMKQAKIVEETRWSNAKVSQLLSQMAEDGRIEKLRIGRENLISLPKDGDGGRYG